MGLQKCNVRNENEIATRFGIVKTVTRVAYYLRLHIYLRLDI